MSTYDTLISETLSEAEFDERDNVCVECPKCGKKKFYFSRSKGVGICFVCNYTANAVSLIMDLRGCTYEQAYMLMCRLIRGRAKSLVVEESTEEATASPDAAIRNRLFEALSGLTQDASSTKSELGLPEFSKPAGQSHEAMHYLTKTRGVPKAAVSKFKLCYVPRSVNDRMAGHIIFPNYDRRRGTLNFWTSRSVFEPKYGSKSYNPRGVARKSILFGGWALRKNLGTLFVVEGPMDCVCFNGRAVALLGKFISNDHMALIKKIKVERIVVALDEDAREDREKVAMCLSSVTDARVLVVSDMCGAKDPADLCKKMKARSGKELAACLIQRARPYSVASSIRTLLGA